MVKPINLFFFAKFSFVFAIDLTIPSISLTPSTTVALFRAPRILETKHQESLEMVGYSLFLLS